MKGNLLIRMSEKNNFRKIAVIGLGYVGLPLCIRFCESGLKVIGLDVDQEKVEAINKGKSYIKHIDAGIISKLRSSGVLSASIDFSEVKQCDAVLICVPTPLGNHREPDISYVLETGNSIAPFIKQQEERFKKLVVLESTTYPGTTDEQLKQVLEDGSGMIAGKDFHLAYSPEREDPGRTDHSVKSIPKVMGGYTKECLQKCVDLYSIALDEVCPVSSTKVAEATKLTENIFRCVNIALVNELKVVYEKMGINVWEVIEAASTKPFGFVPYYPGPGLGGHCIPIDPYYLTWKAREYGMHTRFVELAGEINSSMPSFVVSRIIVALNSLSLSVSASKILILGASYKKNIDDIRESPSLEIIKELIDLNSIVSFSDPYVENLCIDNTIMKSVDLSPEVIKSFDLVALLVDHDCFNYDCIRLNARMLVDTRGKFSDSNNIWQA